MNHAKRFGAHGPLDSSLSVHPKRFVFFDKKTGTRHFEVKTGEDGSVGVDQAVNMLAMYCVARHHMPREFIVMVMAGEEFVDDLMRRTMKLMRTCSVGMTRLPLSPRQYQVLGGIAQGLSNKEIAVKLNLSERTVKFHVSAMLEKFGVHCRTGLLMKAGDFLAPESAWGRETNPECLPVLGNAAPGLTSPTAKPRLLIPMERRAGR